MVALGVEWVAKPRLEARKERILAKHRARADVTRWLNRAKELAYIMLGPTSGRLEPASVYTRAMYRKETARVLEEFRVCAGDFKTAVIDATPYLGTDERNTLLQFSGYLRAYVDTPSASTDFRPLADKIEQVVEWNALPRWRRRARRKLSASLWPPRKPAPLSADQ
ncbi:hypothetical protein B0E53_00433 [Micromonospora sp. MH33]|nr:hypothetical protein B0E53_00433 [Micromonospora sp. MH33]